jgi:2-polyprenyl-6-methoxyphenol hydroxylase-like FAD-dependent oxidoreductase
VASAAVDTEALVVGAVLAGLTLSNLLSTLGVKHVVVELNATTSDIPKAIVVDDEFFRTPHAIGVAEEFVQRPRLSVAAPKFASVTRRAANRA